ncbi:uncharacterized protein KY384_000977 [Bacidia gigantensis]|uniref:uncharacterized protein n=1 Tax=Bacidia gigantensis TaxID=2732470 RepID=UPI001D049656|nr:uncharacterized protein KY384_000977 [Bacidia gigantensis]KAG8534133.1 hypothetical protein KY384_000977 [Bacidia gigantensis]
MTFSYRSATSSSLLLTTLEFNGNTFSLVERVNILEAAESFNANLLGQVRVQQAKECLPSKIVVEVFTDDRAVGHGSAIGPSIVDFEEDVMTLDLQRTLIQPFAGRVDVVIWIEPGTKLDLLYIDVTHLGVLSGARSKKSSCKAAVTTGADLTYPYCPHENKAFFESKNITIVAGSNSVKGIFPLYDTLDVRTTSGNIDIQVSPKGVSDPIQPANLMLHTRSGKINSGLLSLNVPDRNYTNTISSYSGSINAVILHGNATTMRTISSSIRGNIYPYGFNGTRTFIDTRTASGHLNLTVNPSLSHPEDAIDRLSTNHRTTSGSQAVSYPDTYQGTVEASSASGSVDIQWDGFKVIEDQNGGDLRNDGQQEVHVRVAPLLRTQTA